MSNFFYGSSGQSSETPKRVIGIRPLFGTQAGAEPEEAPDFSYERSLVLQEANEQARKMIEQAQAEKQAILQEAEHWKQNWEQEKEALQRTAYEEAFQKGALEGRDAGYRETSELIQEAKSTVECSKVEYEKNVERAERTIVELAVSCAERILRSEIESNEERFIGIVRSALKEVRNQKEVQIHVHPSNYDLTISQKDEIEALFPSDINCYIFPNEDAEPYACFIETSNGRIDTGIDTQLQQLRKTLLQLLESE